MIGIYKIENKVNGKVYVGQAKDIFKRWREHEKALIKGCHHNYKLQDAFQTNHEEISSFEFSILETCSEDELDSLEVKYMKEYKVLDDRYGYNIRTEGILTNDTNIINKPTNKNRNYLIKEDELNMYDEEYRNLINSRTKVNIYEVLSLMWCFYGYICEIEKNNDIEDWVVRNNLDVCISHDISRSIKYAYLKKDGFFRYTKYSYSGACYNTMKKSHYDDLLKEDLYNEWIDGIRIYECKNVRLVEILKLINKLNEHHMPSCSYKILIYIKVLGLYFTDNLYKYYALEDVCIDELKDQWGRKFNVWEMNK